MACSSPASAWGLLPRRIQEKEEDEGHGGAEEGCFAATRIRSKRKEQPRRDHCDKGNEPRRSGRRRRGGFLLGARLCADADAARLRRASRWLGPLCGRSGCSLVSRLCMNAYTLVGGERIFADADNGREQRSTTTEAMCWDSRTCNILPTNARLPTGGEGRRSGREGTDKGGRSGSEDEEVRSAQGTCVTHQRSTCSGTDIGCIEPQYRHFVSLSCNRHCACLDHSCYDTLHTHFVTALSIAPLRGGAMYGGWLRTKPQHQPRSPTPPPCAAAVDEDPGRHGGRTPSALHGPPSPRQHVQSLTPTTNDSNVSRFKVTGGSRGPEGATSDADFDDDLKGSDAGGWTQRMGLGRENGC